MIVYELVSTFHDAMVVKEVEQHHPQKVGP